MPRNARVEEHVEDALLAAHTKGIEARPRNGAEDEWAPGPYRARLTRVTSDPLEVLESAWRRAW